MQKYAMLWTVSVLVVSTLVATVVLATLNNEHAGSYITILIGFVTPTVAALLFVFAEVNRVHKDVNSRLTQLVETTEKLARAEGKVEGTREERARVETASQEKQP